MSQTINTSVLKNSFDLSEYLLDLLKSNSSPQTLREIIKNDIKETKTQLSQHLSKIGCHENQLSIKYNNLVLLQNQIKSIEFKINGFIESDLIERINRLSAICEETNQTINRSKHLSNIINKFEKINYEIELINDSFNRNLYEIALQHILNGFNIHKELSLEIESNTDLTSLSKDIKDLMHSLKTDLIIKRQELIHNIRELFNSYVKTFRDEFKKESVFKFELIKYFKDIEYEKFINTLVNIGENETLLRELTKSLNLYFIKPIVNEEVNQIEFANETQIIATFIDGLNCSPLSLLKTFFNYLNQLITNKNKESNARKLVGLLGQFWANDIFDQILRSYLNRLMPKNESEVSSYLRLVDEAEGIRVLMIEIGFIDGNNTSPFIEFASNISFHFASRLCQDFINSAKTMICQDLHQTVEVNNNSDHKSDQLTSYRVSQFIVDLKNLIQDIINLSNQCSTDCALALNETIANICELYIDISPVYHKKMITQFPQQNAIFHNNCIYFAYFIKSFTLKYRSLNTLHEFVPILQYLGSEVFLKQMRTQEKEILAFIKSPHFNQCLNYIANEESNSKSENEWVKGLRHGLKQCLVHLNFLKNAFTDVLPQKVYDKAIGTVINTLFNEILHKILLLNDISSSGALQLSQQIEYLLEEVKRFLDSKSPITLVHKWTKLNELNLILNANLAEIVDRWADGKGILAAEYSAQEVKHLMRALFQNTERRALALSKIKSSDL